MRLSVVIPARNEEQCLKSTVCDLHATLRQENIDHEILVVNDNSEDKTGLILDNLEKEISTLRCVNNGVPSGFGLAVRRGLECCTGEAVATYMADGSDKPEDLVSFFVALRENNVDCVFGTRFSKSSRRRSRAWPRSCPAESTEAAASNPGSPIHLVAAACPRAWRTSPSKNPGRPPILTTVDRHRTLAK